MSDRKCKILAASLLVSLFCVGTGCALPPTRPAFHINENAAPDEEIDKAEQELETLEDAGAQAVAPTEIKKAETSLLKAIADLGHGVRAPLVSRVLLPSFGPG